ncbi:polysaccharide biosynthesis protein GtrA [Aliarcobacter trophiarum LMG 25534]|uniref:Polysaccharide biosynthesis protein GtrA n=1 Tax=Aliarcobacter trophiarum LMG 25534 TaxID=1032241 RepID=A0AAD0VMY0_9BACT|nr:GtrA family protein [Aliarcobacter trophiarum]AXK49654.1 polysaccharide biosynthesis protein, GtrA family [Aliarcobacter trophiarum LMG 25534]RXJ89395.1 polysaccharide biosynthesis protein GtrA [Aliarcobacter trophiarum LMG 25534]
MLLVLKYSFFALIATIINLFTQFISLAIYSQDFSLYIAMFFGTLTGLIAKYILDKKYIFYYVVKDKKEDSQKFILYSIMGVFTTLIFWGFEIGFDYIFDSEIAKYIGAIIGLSIGYIVKYFLDKKFVFKD